MTQYKSIAAVFSMSLMLLSGVASQTALAAPSYANMPEDDAPANFSPNYYKCYQATGERYECLANEIKFQQNQLSALNAKMRKDAALFENPKKGVAAVDQAHKKWLELKDLQCNQYVRLWFEGGQSIGSNTTDLCNAMMIRDRVVLLKGLLD